MLDMGYFDYSLEPRRAILFEDVKSNYASIECRERGLDPLTTSLCVMSRSDNSMGLILASSPMFKKVFGKSNVGRSHELPFYPQTRKFNYSRWDKTHRDFYRNVEPPSDEYIRFIEDWAKKTYIVPPRMGLYIQSNIQVLKLFATFTSMAEIHPYSIDESFLDVTESLDYYFPDETDYYKKMDLMAQKIQRTIYHQTRLYVTIGMGDNPLLAKLAMDNYAKHSQNMRALIRYEDVEEKVWSIQEMTDFWGINVRTKRNFEKIGIHSIRELANANPDLIKREMKTIGLQHFFHANGIDETSIHDQYQKASTSFGNSQILPRDYTRQEEVEIVLNEMCEQVAVRLRKEKKEATSLSFFVGFSAKEPRPTIHVSRKIDPTNATVEIQRTVLQLFRERFEGGAVRSVGISANGLIDAPFRLISLFDGVEDDKEIQRQHQEEKIQEAMDTIRKKQGFTAIQKATILKRGSRAIERSKLIGGHSAGGLEGLS
ncbi:ImpB/MucB/SamB family protein [Lactococcus lactis subsp. lactis]|nr:ImpB/MucB/SamB family protein [Lactococcus lactis subsp. lactis]